MPEIGKIFAGDDALLFSVGRRGRTELWRSDGSPQGTTRVAALPHPSQATAKGVVREGAFLNDVLLFAVSSDYDAPNVWRSDGTENGTVPPGASSASPQ